MQLKQKLAYIALGCVLLFWGVVLFINVQAQAPKQTQIAFDSYRDGNWEIYVMNADGGNPRNLTKDSANDSFPDWFDPAFAHAVSSAGKRPLTWGWLKNLKP